MYRLVITFLCAAIFVGGAIAGVALQRPDLANVSSASQLLMNQWANLTPKKPVKIIWPPKLGEPYPDLELADHTGKVIRLSDFRGKVLIVEMIGMECQACQAFAGAHEIGSYRDVPPQKDLKSFRQYMNEFAPDVDANDERLVHVQILVYGPSSIRPPTVAEGHEWAEHFELETQDNTLVLVGTQKMISKASREMIPSFQLIDKDFVLQVDAGNPPRQDLYLELLPRIAELLRQPPTAEEPQDGLQTPDESAPADATKTTDPSD